MSVKDAAKRWGISDRRVRLLCSSGKVEGTVRDGRSYEIPEHAVKPADGRAVRQKDIPEEFRKVFLRIDGKRDELLRRREGGWVPSGELWEKFLLELAWPLVRRGGSSLTPEETGQILKGVPAAGKPLAEHLEVLGIREAAEWIQELAAGQEELSEALILRLHAMVLMGRRREGGLYRSRAVRLSGTDNEPPQPFMVPVMLDWLLKEYEEKKKKLHALELIPRLHMDFEWVHPFEDGNTRVGWMLMDLELMRAGYPPVRLSEGSLEDYYRALGQYYEKSNEAPMIHLVTGLVEESLDQWLRCFAEPAACSNL